MTPREQFGRHSPRHRLGTRTGRARGRGGLPPPPRHGERALGEERGVGQGEAQHEGRQPGLVEPGLGPEDECGGQPAERSAHRPRIAVTQYFVWCRGGGKEAWPELLERLVVGRAMFIRVCNCLVDIR